MSIAVKICGLSTLESVVAATQGGARFVGFVFYPPSPRHVTPEQAAGLCEAVPSGVKRVGVFVDADDEAVGAAVGRVPLDLLQFHGRESPERVAAVKRRFGRPVMKAIPVAAAADLAAAPRYFGAADWLLFDAKPPRGTAGTLPGGNGLIFDWELLGGKRWPLPWMLSGGLTVENLPEAVRITHATALDVSSGVERKPGVKDLDKIAAFLARAREM